MADVERWPDIIPQFADIKLSSEPPLRLDSRARVRPRGLFGSIWVVSEFEEGRSFAWEADLAPGIHLLADHTVVAVKGGSRLALSLSYSGLLATLLSPALGLVFRRNVRQEGEGIKVYCERPS